MYTTNFKPMHYSISSISSTVAFVQNSLCPIVRLFAVLIEALHSAVKSSQKEGEGGEPQKNVDFVPK